MGKWSWGLFGQNTFELFLAIGRAASFCAAESSEVLLRHVYHSQKFLLFRRLVPECGLLQDCGASVPHSQFQSVVEGMSGGVGWLGGGICSSVLAWRALCEHLGLLPR